MPQRLLKLCYEQLLRVTVFTPPAILGFESLLGLIEQDDLHAALDVGPGTPTRPSLDRPPSRPRPDPETRAVRPALRQSVRRRSLGPRLPLRPVSPLVHQNQPSVLHLNFTCMHVRILPLVPPPAAISRQSTRACRPDTLDSRPASDGTSARRRDRPPRDTGSAPDPR